jgi:probable O-glycosylation ligase (exosortase A-associated)
MRDVAVILAFVLALPFAVRFTWAAVLLWTWVSLMNPHRLAFGFAQTTPFAAMAAGAALVSLLFNRNNWRALGQPVVLALLLFLLWMCITTLAAFNPVESSVQLNKVLKIQLMTLIALVALQTRRQIDLFVWANVLSVGFYGFKGGVFTVVTGGENRVWGPPGGFIEGNNELALALVMTLPLMNYLRLSSQRQGLRAALLVLMALSVVAVAGSQSRGAFLALLAMAAMLWLRSRHKLATGLALTLASFTVLALMPSAWEDRMRTIQTYEADNSALGRINAWWSNFNLANHRFTGGGFEIYTPEIFGRFAPDPSNIKVAHSIYFSVLGEHGWIGLLLFLLVWLLALRLSGQIAAMASAQPDAAWARDLVLMCQVSLVGYAVGGAFLSLAYFDLPYNLVVLLVASRYLLQTQGQTVPAKAGA